MTAAALEFDRPVANSLDAVSDRDFAMEFLAAGATLAAIGGRTIHTYHTEGAGGGHAPDIIKACGLSNVLPSSTNPTRPYTINTIDRPADIAVRDATGAIGPEDIFLRQYPRIGSALQIVCGFVELL